VDEYGVFIHPTASLCRAIRSSVEHYAADRGYLRAASLPNLSEFIAKSLRTVLMTPIYKQPTNSHGHSIVEAAGWPVIPKGKGAVHVRGSLPRGSQRAYEHTREF
jgi:hypothetical protein